MLMLDAMKGVKPKKKTRLSSIAGGALLLAGLGAAVPAINAKQEAGTGLVEMLVAGKRSKEIRPITEASDAYLTFSKDIEKVAVGSPDIIKVASPTKRDVVLNGAKVGRTSVTVWYVGGGNEQFMVTVQRDISILESAIAAIDKGISVTIAPDRDAVVLQGSVASPERAKAAEDAATRYLGSKQSGDKGDRVSGKVINLIIVEYARGAQLEDILKRAAEELLDGSEAGDERDRIDRVDRIMHGSTPNDDLDQFVIYGAVDDDWRREEIIEKLERVLTDKWKIDQVVTSETYSFDQVTKADAGVVAPLPGGGAMNAAAGQLNGLSGSVSKLTSSSRPKLGPRIHDRISVRRGFRWELERAIRAQGAINVSVQYVNGSTVLRGHVRSQELLVKTLMVAGSVVWNHEQELLRKLKVKEVTTTYHLDGSYSVTEKDAQPAGDPGSIGSIKVVANESGALATDSSSRSAGSGTAASGILGAGGGSRGASGAGMLSLLENNIQSNIGRAKALALLGGRLMSFIEVEDIPQVRVDIKLYEINRTALLTWNSQQSGAVTDFKTGSTLRDPAFVQNPVTGEFQPDPNATPVDNPDIRNVLSFLGGGLSNRLQISGNHVQIDSLLSLLEKEGIARSLSSPQLTVLSGELAFFGVGGTVPIQNSVVTQFGGTGGNTQAGGVSGILNQTVERDFGIRLSVRPLVEEDGMITLDVVPSVSQPDSDLTRQIRESTGQSLATTAFQERSLRTSARMRDGATLLIGGLTSRARTDNTNQTPFLHNIPILGALFKGYSYGDDDRELVIVVNPVIVREAPRDAPLWAFPDTSEMTQPAKPAPAKQ